MDRGSGVPPEPFAISDWLELGARLGPDQRQALLVVLDAEVRKLGATSQNLARLQRAMMEGGALLRKLRQLGRDTPVDHADRQRLSAVVAMIEDTQRLMADHYMALAREWLRAHRRFGRGAE